MQITPRAWQRLTHALHTVKETMDYSKLLQIKKRWGAARCCMVEYDEGTGKPTQGTLGAY